MRSVHCPIIRAYLFPLAHDPNNVVRRTMVRRIRPTRLTLPNILEGTRDTDEHIRRSTSKSLTINQRQEGHKRGQVWVRGKRL